MLKRGARVPSHSQNSGCFRVGFKSEKWIAIRVQFICEFKSQQMSLVEGASRGSFHPNRLYPSRPPEHYMTLMSSSTPAPSISEEKPRSRNAKAQARHRAKRKAYIEQVCHSYGTLYEL